MCSDKIHQGGGVAAPVGGQIFNEILPYLEANKVNSDEDEKVEQLETPDVIGKTIEEGRKILKENGLEMIIENESEEIDEKNTLIVEQIPKAGIVVNKGSKVYLK